MAHTLIYDFMLTFKNHFKQKSYVFASVKQAQFPAKDNNNNNNNGGFYFLSDTDLQ